MKTSVPIGNLLNNKNPAVWSVDPNATVFEAIRLMADKNIGALLVMSNGALTGVFTERDYARKIALQGKNSRDTRVREIMTNEVHSVTAEDTLEDCMHLMTDHRIRHLPVTKGQQVVGIVSIGDLVNWTISAQDAAIEQMERYIAGGVAA